MVLGKCELAEVIKDTRFYVAVQVFCSLSRHKISLLRYSVRFRLSASVIAFGSVSVLLFGSMFHCKISVL
jgi:hypothetical protein